MARFADRVTHSDELRALREQASAVMDKATPMVEDAADRIKATAADTARTASDPIRQALTYLPAVLDIVASFRTRTVQAAGDAADRVSAAMPRVSTVRAALPARQSVMDNVRPVLFGMALATAAYAAYRYSRRP